MSSTPLRALASRRAGGSSGAVVGMGGHGGSAEGGLAHTEGRMGGEGGKKREEKTS